MTDANISALIANGAAIIAALAAVIAASASFVNNRKLRTMHTDFNSRNDELLRVTSAAARAAGREEGAIAERAVTARALIDSEAVAAIATIAAAAAVAAARTAVLGEGQNP